VGTVGGAVSVGVMVAATGVQLTITNANPTTITGSFFIVTFPQYHWSVPKKAALFENGFL
jgi:hypothetical protein